MKKLVFLVLTTIFTSPFVAQEVSEAPFGLIDSLYREDQLYVGLTFHLLSDLPEEVTQKGFSGGFHLGFIRDFPLNKRRNIALGAGIGWSINTYGQELFIGKNSNGETTFKDLNALDLDYDTNRFSTQLIEAPIQFRWRTSTPQSYKFWRIYTGVRLGYVYYFKSNFNKGENQVVINNPPELQKFRVGTTFTFGYSTFNFHVYYSLNPFFKNASLNDSEIGISTIKLGLMFYIL